MTPDFLIKPSASAPPPSAPRPDRAATTTSTADREAGRDFGSLVGREDETTSPHRQTAPDRTDATSNPVRDDADTTEEGEVPPEDRSPEVDATDETTTTEEDLQRAERLLALLTGTPPATDATDADATVVDGEVTNIAASKRPVAVGEVLRLGQPGAEVTKGAVSEGDFAAKPDVAATGLARATAVAAPAAQAILSTVAARQMPGAETAAEGSPAADAGDGDLLTKAVPASGAGVTLTAAASGSAVAAASPAPATANRANGTVGAVGAEAFAALIAAGDEGGSVRFSSEVAGTAVAEPSDGAKVPPPTFAATAPQAGAPASSPVDVAAALSEVAPGVRGETRTAAPVTLPQLPDAVSAQVRAMLPTEITPQTLRAADGSLSTEMELAPAELGRLRVVLQTTERGLHLFVAVERPEALEQVRRHLEGLHRALIEDGVTLDGVDIGTGDREQAGFAEGADTGAGEHGPTAPIDDTLASEPPPPRVIPAAGRLDISL